MILIGHRGAAGLAPENTASSLQVAVEMGVDMVEVDLRKTADNQIVLSHDPNLLRTHDDRRAICKVTLNEIRALGAQENREIPEFGEYLQKVKMPIILELKEPGLEELVLEKIKDFPHKVIISSFHIGVLKKIRALDGKIPLGFILSSKVSYIFPLVMAVARSLDLYSIHPHHSLVTPAHMKAMKRLNAKVFTWTVNDVHTELLMKGFGVDGIFTDYPNLFKQYG